MNRIVLDALAAVAGDFYSDALRRYPSLLLDADQQPDDEALIVWQVLMAIDELAIAVQEAIAFDEAQRAPAVSAEREDLPF